jgi:hypothetical protein
MDNDCVNNVGMTFIKYASDEDKMLLCSKARVSQMLIFTYLRSYICLVGVELCDLD